MWTAIAPPCEVMRIQFAVTTSKSAPPAIMQEAMQFSAGSGWPYAPRRSQTVSRIVAETGMDGAIVFEADRMVIWTGGKAHYFHPNMAKIRIKSLVKGGRDPMVEAMQLVAGDSVLDCTCGMGADSVVASYVVGEAGSVYALEASSLLALMVKEGLQSYRHRFAPITEAMRRIRLRHAASQQVLTDLPANSWDVVYFDPMFEATIDASKGIDLVRLLGERGGPSSEALQQAVRVARRSVVMKDRWPGDALRKTGSRIVSQSRRICFGVIDAKAGTV